MFFSIFHTILIKYNKKPQLAYFIAIPIYIILMNFSWFQYYSSLIISFDLYILSQSINNKENNKLKEMTNEFTELAKNYFSYIKDKTVDDNSKLVKDYKQKKINITDTLQQTIETIKNS